MPVPQQRPGRRRVGVRVEWQHVDFRIPEHQPVVAVAVQTLGSQRNLVVSRIGQRSEMKDVEPDCLLGAVIALDAHVGILPDRRPGSGVAFDHGGQRPDRQFLERLMRQRLGLGAIA